MSAASTGPGPDHRSGDRRLRARPILVGVIAAAVGWMSLVVPVETVRAAEAPSGYVGLSVPKRLLDTRPAETTFDGRDAGGGLLAGGTTYELAVRGRAGVDAAAGAVVVNITAIAARERGYVTAHPCDRPRPTTSNVNYAPGDTVAGAAIVPVGDDGAICLYVHGTTHLAVDLTGTFSDRAFQALDPARRIVDTRPGNPTDDGRHAGAGAFDPGEVRRIDVGGRLGLPAVPGPTLLTITVIGLGKGYVTAWGCAGDRPATSNVNVHAGQVIANTAIVDIGGDGRLCLLSAGTAHVVVDVVGRFLDGTVSVLPAAARLLDTRLAGATTDGEAAGKGLRRRTATLELPTRGRGGVPDGAAAAVVNLIAVAPRDRGYVTVHPPSDATPLASNVNHQPSRTIANQAIVPLGPSGDLCLHNSADTHLVVDVVAWISGPIQGPLATGCPTQDLFPHWRMVAMYGTARSGVLGVLGEQPPEQAAARLDQVVAPWERVSDRPVLPTFEVIATLATAAPGSAGLYRSRSSDELIQRYLDAARRDGVYLLLDLQPGRSDFLTEARAYERFLREPDVGLALDPEWRTEPPATPGGGYVGQVDASEVNAVADWLAGLVAEEDLPEKLLVVHQFQTRMITNKSSLREPEGIALTIHMDGFGTRSQKLATYSFVHVDPPWNNGFKLFFDEDVAMFSPGELLATVRPVPDLITYQ